MQPSILEPGLLELLVPLVAGRSPIDRLMGGLQLLGGLDCPGLLELLGLCVVALVVHEVAHGIESGIETRERDRRVEIENGEPSFYYNS